MWFDKKKKWPPHAKVKNQVAEQYALLLLVCLKVHMYKCIEKQPTFTTMVNGGLLWKIESGIEDKDFIFFSTVSFITKIYISFIMKKQIQYYKVCLYLSLPNKQLSVNIPCAVSNSAQQRQTEKKKCFKNKVTFRISILGYPTLPSKPKPILPKYWPCFSLQSE